MGSLLSWRDGGTVASGRLLSTCGGVHKSFGSVQAVRRVALTVGSGGVTAFLGPNGAGKTSTIDMILGLSRPDAGQVEAYGMAPRQAVRNGLVSVVMHQGVA